MSNDTPNDAARPVAHAEIDAKGEAWRIRIGGPDNHCTTPLYTATDYDKLREEVERLRLWRDTLSEQADTNLRDWAAVKAQLVEERTRAEAAEATLDDFIEAAEHYFNTGTADALRAVLNDQINAQGESNG
ncbi:hypothetical protein [Lysobacter antibioticus]|uniref:hypothetical protein n=1 Tax=Lysobacter antibioticus TaxID=84531 RepID=UPI00034A7F80|nr:hypothetical protein [Lysobacter antibioticus]